MTMLKTVLFLFSIHCRMNLENRENTVCGHLNPNLSVQTMSKDKEAEK
jgi:hypothetical protein